MVGNPNWKPGVSGNPGGRPGMAKEVRELAQKHSAEAIEVLAKLMRNEKASPAARAAAASHILDRAVGRPEASLNATLETKNLPDFNVLTAAEHAELNRILDMAAPLFNKVIAAQGNAGGSSVN
jgi:HEAT repeat protein